jgi:hypothetical protein
LAQLEFQEVMWASASTPVFSLDFATTVTVPQTKTTKNRKCGIISPIRSFEGHLINRKAGVTSAASEFRAPAHSSRIVV